MGEKCQLIVLLKIKNIVFVNKSLRCHMWMFHHSNIINSVISDFREVIGYFYDGKCR